MKALLDALAQNVDFVVIDLPPINEVADALVVSQYVDGMVMVVRQNYAHRSQLSSAMRQLEHAGAKVLGFVMTASTTQSKGKYKGKYKKYYDTDKSAEKPADKPAEKTSEANNT